MNFNRLIAFVTAAKHLHVTRAAGQLHITQPALSKQLRLLQSECEAKLYYKKDAGGIELTEKGRMFFARGRKILDDLDALKKSLNLPERPAGHFTVGGTYGLASDILPLVLKKFQKTHSGVRVTLRASSSAGIAKGIATGDIEIGLLTILPASNRLEIEPYGTHAIIPFVHAGHPYARRRQVSLTEFAAGPLVVRADAKAQCAAEILLRKQGLRANVMYRCETPHAVRVTVRTKLGVGVLFADCLKNELQTGEFKALNVPGLKLEGKSFIAYRKDRPLSSNARDFHALLHETKQRQKTGSAAPTIGVAVGGGNETGVWQTLRSDRVISFVRRCQLFARRGALSLAQIAEFPVVSRRE